MYICVGSFCKYIIHILKVTLHGTRTMPDSQRYPLNLYLISRFKNV